MKSKDSRVLKHPPAEVKIERDVENTSSAVDQAATCRMCMDSQGNPGDDLISPCMCKGTQQFVHRSCLDHWRSVKEGNAFSHCTTCKAQFHLRVIDYGENSWLKVKFRLFVARDVFLVFLAIQTVIGLMGGLIYHADKHGSLRNAFNDKWDCILSKHPILFYYSIGVIVFFVLFGIVGSILHCYFSRGCDYLYCGGMGNCHPGYLGADPDEAGVVLLVLVVILLLILGITYLFLAATMATQRICQRHYHILTKRELTQEYVVEDLHGCYTPAKLNPKHEERLNNLKLF
uniref:uncharacterized protein LOC122597565 n=1 Tax=Erigeron canadensis TaxID=72917 RepID=UPI001CB94E82|nr:uncharacterized protein LOC122597565 [Erigeron canadensis]